MHIRKGLSTDLARLECCDFSFKVDEIAREPFLNGDLHIEALTEPYLKTYELDLQTLENHCVNPDSIFLIAETDDGEIAGFITASCNWNKFISVDYIAVERSKRRTGAAHKLMSATHVWARSLNAPYRHYGFILGGYDRYLYNALPEKDEVALFWYYMLA